MKIYLIIIYDIINVNKQYLTTTYIFIWPIWCTNSRSSMNREASSFFLTVEEQDHVWLWHTTEWDVRAELHIKQNILEDYPTLTTSLAFLINSNPSAKNSSTNSHSLPERQQVQWFWHLLVATSIFALAFHLIQLSVLPFCVPGTSHCHCYGNRPHSLMVWNKPASYYQGHHHRQRCRSPHVQILQQMILQQGVLKDNYSMVKEHKAAREAHEQLRLTLIHFKFITWWGRNLIIILDEQ